MKILVTGSNGFIGKHLVEALRRRPDTEVIEFDLGSSAEALERGLREADVIFHLAGVNRPLDPSEFQTGNAGFTGEICRRLVEVRGQRSEVGRQRSEDSGESADLRSPTSDRRPPVLVLSSSIQAALDNPYGVSKRQAEEVVADWARRERGRAVIFRLKNVFGKWCRPNYNSVTATFCHNIAHGLPITISDPDRELDLVYIDDVVSAFLGVLDEVEVGGLPEVAGQKSEVSVRKSEVRGRTTSEVSAPISDSRSPASALRSPTSDGTEFRDVPRSFRITLGELAAKIRSFHDSRATLTLPSFADEITRRLYATYLSYLDGSDFGYSLEQKTDPRGSLAEFLKAPSFGQVFVSRTKPGITRGNHYHHSKAEKFLVLEGDAVIRFRHILGGEIIEHPVNGKEFKVVDIPPGYTHSIENVGDGELVTLFWASEIFDPAQPDTIAMPVLEPRMNR